MTIYLHRVSGVCPAGDIFSFGWHSNTPLALASTHANAVTWTNGLWGGAGTAPGIGAQYPVGLHVTKVTTYQLDPVTSKTVGVLEDDMDLPGTSVDNSLPQDVAVVVSLRTADPSRKGRGRFYLPAPAVTTASLTGELQGLAVLDFVLSAAAAWATVNGPGQETPVVYSRSTATFQTITKLAVGTVFDIQTRRVNKVNTVRTFEAMP
jgi:hypothetical protein